MLLVLVSLPWWQEVVISSLLLFSALHTVLQSPRMTVIADPRAKGGPVVGVVFLLSLSRRLQLGNLALQMCLLFFQSGNFAFQIRNGAGGHV